MKFFKNSKFYQKFLYWELLFSSQNFALLDDWLKFIKLRLDEGKTKVISRDQCQS